MHWKTGSFDDCYQALLKFIYVRCFLLFMGKMLLLFFVFLFSVSLVSGAVSRDYAYVTITVINAPPEVVDVSFSSEVYEGRTIGCEAEVVDDVPETVSLKKEWFVNDELVFEGEEFSGFIKGDIVECLVTPTDQYGLIGNQMGLSMEAQGKISFFRTLMSFF